jgi:hypothetical protein
MSKSDLEWRGVTLERLKSERPAAEAANVKAATSAAARRPALRWLPLVLVLLPILFNLLVLRGEQLPVQNLNDTSKHLALTRLAEDRISQGHLPFDSWWPEVSLGWPEPHHYQSFPHAIGGVISLVFGAQTTVQWILYLGLALWPLAVYWGARLLGLDRWAAGCAALVSPLVMSATSYGYEHQSYTWRGLGMWTQLWGMWALPIALGLSLRAIRRGRGYALAALALSLTIAFHFLTGYLALLALGVWVVISPSQFVVRLRRALLIGVGAIVASAWVLVPLLQDSKFSARSALYQDNFWFDSYGAGKVLGWLWSGELFDFGRWPVLSLLVLLGAGVAVARFRRDEVSRAVLGFTLLSLFLFCGRPTFGTALKLFPGSDDLFLHRYLFGVHLGGMLLAGTGIAWLGRRVFEKVSSSEFDRWRRAVVPVGAILLVVFLAPAWTQIAHFDRQGATWIHEQRAADSTDGADLQKLVDIVQEAGNGRVYAGMTNNWGRTDYRVYSVPVYQELLNRGADQVGFTLRTVSILSDPEFAFYEGDPVDADVFNVKYMILPQGHAPPSESKLIASSGRHRLYEMPTTGYLEVVDTVSPPISADRATMDQQPTAFLNSGLPYKKRFPTVSYDGEPAARASLPLSADPSSPAGSVDSQYALPDDGTFGGIVTANRRAVVLLKASYHPRWHVTVDGRPARTQMVAPGMVAVPVPEGTHRVEFVYEPYPHYLLLFAVGGLAILLLALFPPLAERRRRRWSRPPAESLQSPTAPVDEAAGARPNAGRAL